MTEADALREELKELINALPDRCLAALLPLFKLLAEPPYATEPASPEKQGD